MVKTKKFSRIAAMLLALVMLLTVVPFQGLAAEADPAELQLKDGTVAISSDMTDDQIKKVLFDALVANPEGKNYSDYDWQYYCEGKNTEIYKRWDWVSIKGEITYAKPPGIVWEEDYHHPAIKDNSDTSYKIRVVGNPTEVTVNKVSSCSVTYNYDVLQGSVLVNNSPVTGTVTGVSPAKDLYFTVVANAGYEIESVKANGVELQAKDGVYSVLPVADTKIDVTFKEIGTLYDVTINAGEGVTVTLNGNPVTGTVKVSADEKYTLVYTPDENTSVKSVKLGDADVTADVSFSNYVGTQYVTFTGDSTLTVETVAVSDEFALTDVREVGIVINADGSWNYDGIRANIIDALVDKEQSVDVEFTQDNVEITYWNHGRVNGQYVPLEWKDDWGITWDGQLTFPDAAATGSVNLRVYFKGNDQFRPVEYMYADYVKMIDVQTSVIAIKEAPVVTLSEKTPGVIDYTNVKEKVYEAAIDTENSLPQGMKFEEMIFTIPEVTTSGTYKVKAEYVGSTSYYASSTEFDVYFNVIVLPEADIAIKAPEISVVLNEIGIGKFDVEALKKDVFDLAVDAQASTPVLSYDDVTIEFNGDVTQGGKFTATISYVPSNSYRGTSEEVSVNVTVNYLPTVKVEAVTRELVLRTTADGAYNYDGLKQDIFKNCLTVSGVDGLTWSDFSYQYKLRDGVSGSIWTWQNFEYYLTPSYNYLYKGGEFEIKVSIPDSDAYHGTTVEFKINLDVAKREDTKVVLNGGSMDWIGDLNAIKEYIYNNFIDFDRSILPEDVTVDNFSFEYYANNYTAGGLPGLEWSWVPFEGMQHPSLAGSYFNPLSGGTHKIRVRFTGTEDYLPYTSNEVELTINKTSFDISLKQNYKYLDEDLPADFVQPSVNDNFEHYYFVLDASTDTGVIYLDSLSGLELLDFTGNISFSWWLTEILGTGVTADSIYNRDGISRDQLVKLLSDSRMVDYLAGYAIDKDAVDAMLELINSVPENVTKFTFQMGQPTKPGTYTIFAMATNANYYTAYTSSVFYVKYHSTGTKLVFVQDTANLTAKNASTFDFSAVVTKDGIPIASDNVRYIYTGFRANALFYGSTKEPCRQAGIYTQTAWTFLGTYAFPKTRTYTVPLFDLP